MKDYVALYLGFTEAEVQETYGNKPHVLKKYGLITEINSIVHMLLGDVCAHGFCSRERERGD